jgi:Spy/CpxP family protein refolding chaperone
MTRNTVRILGFVAVLLATAVPAVAQGLPRGPGRWWVSEKYKLELKLTEEQSAKIEQIFQTSMERLRTEKADLDSAQDAFRQVIAKPDADELEYMRAVDRVEMARYTISKERTLMLVRIHRVLTPEQRMRLQAMQKRDNGTRKSR